MSDNTFLQENYALAFIIGTSSGLFIFAVIIAIMLYFHRRGELIPEDRIDYKFKTRPSFRINMAKNSAINARYLHK